MNKREGNEMNDKRETGRMLAELRRSNAAGYHQKRRDRKNDKRKAVQDSRDND